MVRADRHALAAVDALGPVDGRAALHDGNRLLRAGADARPRKAADAAVRNLHMAVDAAVAADGADRKHRIGIVVPGLRVDQILLQLARLIGLFLHAEPHQRHQPVFQHGAVLVDAAAVRLVIARTHFNRNPVDVLLQCPVIEVLNETDHELTARPLGIIHSAPPAKYSSRRMSMTFSIVALSTMRFSSIRTNGALP